MGNSVVVVSPDTHLGGLSLRVVSGGQIVEKEAIGGLAREFYHRVWRHYQSVDSWKWQAMEDYGNRGQGTLQLTERKERCGSLNRMYPKKSLETWVKEHDLDVIRNEWLDRERGVEISDGIIRAISTLSGNRYEGKCFWIVPTKET